ncbi:E-selectin-like [Diadema setosum]|uniref:E-selectin-like n=1 Tax=Diadema setosum TaxID=31175 RepID=UPI003B3BB030
MKNCSWTSAECPFETAVKVKCREPGYLGCYTSELSSSDSPLFQNFTRHGVESNAECASTCQEQRQVADVAVIHQGACVCVPSDTFAAMSSSDTYLHGWSCPSIAELKFRPTVYYAFSVSHGFCKELDIVPNGKWDFNITWFGAMVTLTCDQDYTINGSANLQCVGLPGRSTYFPVWNSSVPSFREVNMVLCDHPGNVSNGEWNSVITSLRSSLTLTCDDSYVINGSATLQCVTSRDTNLPVWNTSVPTCQTVKTNAQDQVVLCDHPGNVSNGEWNSVITSLRSSLTLTCDDSYVINGSATLQCVTSRDNNLPVWNTSVPSCQIIKTNIEDKEQECRYPGNVTHGKWDSTTSRLNSTVTLECDRGYVLNGSATLLCVPLSVDGYQPVWNASIPSCHAVESG